MVDQTIAIAEDASNDNSLTNSETRNILSLTNAVLGARCYVH